MRWWFSAKESWMKHPRLHISPAAYIAAAAGVLLLPLNWLLFAVLAALVHELGHLIVLKCCRIDVPEMEIGAFGARITTAPLTPVQEMLCAAAGPLCSFSLLLFADAAPVLALLGLIHGAFNLLPLLPMDGGRIVHAGFRLMTEKISV